MSTLTLIHPRLGLIDIKATYNRYTEEKIKQSWRWRYGKKYLECEVHGTDKYPNSKPVVHLSTGKLFISITEASEKTGIAFSTIRNHCYNDTSIKVNYKRLFKFAS